MSKLRSLFLLFSYKRVLILNHGNLFFSDHWEVKMNFYIKDPSMESNEMLLSDKLLRDVTEKLICNWETDAKLW